MRSPAEAILSAIERDPNGIGLVWCPDFGLRDWLVGEAESLAPQAATSVVLHDVASALAQPNRLVLLVPQDETEVIRDLDAMRDRLTQGRSWPVVVFLLRHGDGQRTMATEAAGLRSWLRGSDADPDAIAEVDPVTERAAFIAHAGEPPEAFLTKWRAEQVPNNARNLGLYYWADLLEGSRG